CRHVDDDEIAGGQAPSELECVALVGLDPVAGSALDVAGRADGDVELVLAGPAREPVAGRTGLVDSPERPLELFEPAQDRLRATLDGSRLDLAGVEVEDCSSGLVSVNVEAHEAGSVRHVGALQRCGYPGGSPPGQ